MITLRAVRTMKNPIAILLVDDDEDDRNLFREALDEIDAAADCFMATDGLNALEFLNNCETLPDFIFVDLNMPRMNGKQLIRELKQNKQFESIPVIIYSTSKIEEDVKETMGLGVALYIKKPVSFNLICKEISMVLKGTWESKKHNLPL